jgi:hypothetical protein
MSFFSPKTEWGVAQTKYAHVNKCKNDKIKKPKNKKAK